MNALTPREIQLRIRSGASVADVAEETGMEPERIEAFAGPVIAEREHIARSATTATVRRRGEAGTHRRLGELIVQRLRSRAIDADAIEWDAWRQEDLKWRIVGRLVLEAESRTAEFVFDPKARFSVAHNADARWMIGEESVDATVEEENTVDFKDEMALVRAISSPEPPPPGDEMPASELMHDGTEDTSQLDRLYDMLSGISEDSVRIYTGILEPGLEPELSAGSESADEELDDATAPEPVADGEGGHASEPAAAVAAPAEPTQDPLVGGEEPRKPRPRKRRAKIPTWDEIMFGGPTTP
ncbi:septation protein SepH [Tessaracoccus sp. Z1128]